MKGMEKYIELLKTLDFSKGPHKDELRAVLKEKFSQSSCIELKDNDLDYVAAALGNTETTIKNQQND